MSQKTTHYSNIPGYLLHQDFIDWYFNSISNNQKIVEVGSLFGRSTSYILDQIENKNLNIELHCIDLWRRWWDERFEYGFPSAWMLEEARKQVQKFGKDNIDDIFQFYLGNRVNQLKMHKGFSHEIAKSFEDNSCDLVFLDGGHRFQEILLDLVSWKNKIKLGGGIIAGDDYGMPEVRKAVTFVFGNNHEVFKCSKNHLVWYVSC